VICPEAEGDAGFGAGPAASEGAAVPAIAGARMGSETIEAEALAAANGLPRLGSGTAWLSAAAVVEPAGLGAGCGRVSDVAQPPELGAFTMTAEEGAPVADAAGDSGRASSGSDGLRSRPEPSGLGAGTGASCIKGFIGSLVMMVVAGSISMALAAPPTGGGPAKRQTAAARYRHPSTIHLLPMAQSKTLRNAGLFQFRYFGFRHMNL
jgi:hypothetical protein